MEIINKADNSVNDCPYKTSKRDCDGDYDIYCLKPGSCPHKNDVRDCDGDIVSLCRQ